MTIYYTLTFFLLAAEVRSLGARHLLATTRLTFIFLSFLSFLARVLSIFAFVDFFARRGVEIRVDNHAVLLTGTRPVPANDVTHTPPARSVSAFVVNARRNRWRRSAWVLAPLPFALRKRMLTFLSTNFVVAKIAYGLKISFMLVLLLPLFARR